MRRQGSIGRGGEEAGTGMDQGKGSIDQYIRQIEIAQRKGWRRFGRFEQGYVRKVDLGIESSVIEE